MYVNALEAILPGWLPRQRWFAGPGEGDRDVGVRVTQVDDLDGLLAVAVESGDATYQLLIGIGPARPGAIGPVPGGLVAYDALTDEDGVRRVLEAMAAGVDIGALHFDPCEAFDPTGPSRPAGAEQSNTSVVVDDRLILKWFRRPAPGPNPDVELPLALAQAGFEHVVGPLATLARDDTTISLLQEYLMGAAEGWGLALSRPPDLAQEIEELGRDTAQMHLTLVRALGAEPADRAIVERWVSDMTAELDHVAARPDAPDDLRQARDRLAAAIDKAKSVASAGQVTRVHGDFHLGQVLRHQGRWVIIDFEGEPAKPLEVRRAKQSPIVDVAGMLRSLEYAAATSSADPGWLADQRRAFLDGYRASVAGQGLVPEDDDFATLLGAFELRKAVYEVEYELAHRPDWVRIPLDGIRRLVSVP